MPVSVFCSRCSRSAPGMGAPWTFPALISGAGYFRRLVLLLTSLQEISLLDRCAVLLSELEWASQATDALL